MKNTFFPFQIGEEYENWEFDLEYLNEEKIKGFDSYLYLWQRAFLYLVTGRIELIFALDILEVVIMSFEFNSREEINQFKQILDQTFDKKSQFENDYLDAEIYQLYGDLELWFIYITIDYRIDIIYGNALYLRMIYD